MNLINLYEREYARFADFLEAPMAGPGLIKRGLAGAASKMSKMRKSQYRPATDLGGVAEKAVTRKVQIGDTKAPAPKKVYLGAEPKKPGVSVKRVDQPGQVSQGVVPKKRVQINTPQAPEMKVNRPAPAPNQGVEPNRRIKIKKPLISDRTKRIGTKVLKAGAAAGAIAGGAGAAVQGADRFNEWRKRRKAASGVSSGFN